MTMQTLVASQGTYFNMYLVCPDKAQDARILKNSRLFKSRQRGPLFTLNNVYINSVSIIAAYPLYHSSLNHTQIIQTQRNANSAIYSIWV